MTSNDPITAILDQLAAHREQLTHLSRTLEDHTAVLTELIGAAPAGPARAPFVPDPVPAGLIPGEGTGLPWSLT